MGLIGHQQMFTELTKDYQLALREGIISYLCMPFADNEIPGAVMERVIEKSNPGSTVLKTYDFVDVVKQGSVGWQVKSTKTTTPITWKRAKIPNKTELMEASYESEAGCQKLGDTLVEFCNSACIESFEQYNLDKIFYARLAVDNFRKEWRYFERLIATKNQPEIFDKSDLVWSWNKQKRNTKKEQLPAFIGTSKSLGIKMFAWHGKGENQLHFSGEKSWHPTEEQHLVRIKYESFRRLDLKELYQLASL